VFDPVEVVRDSDSEDVVGVLASPLVADAADVVAGVFSVSAAAFVPNRLLKADVCAAGAATAVAAASFSFL
jgi:hypothetical protein